MKTATFLFAALAVLSMSSARAQTQRPQAADKQPPSAEAKTAYRQLAQRYDALVSAYRTAVNAQPKQAGRSLKEFQSAFDEFAGMKKALWIGSDKEGKSLAENLKQVGSGYIVKTTLQQALGVAEQASKAADAPAAHTALEKSDIPAHRDMIHWAVNALDMAEDVKKMRTAQAKPLSAEQRQEMQTRSARMTESNKHWQAVAGGSERRVDAARDVLDSAFDSKTAAPQAAGGKEGVFFVSQLKRDPATGDYVYSRDYYEESKRQLILSGQKPPALTHESVTLHSRDFWDGVEKAEADIRSRPPGAPGQLGPSPAAAAAAVADGAKNGDRAAQLRGAAGGAAYLAMDPSSLEKLQDKIKDRREEANDKIQDLQKDRAKQADKLLDEKKDKRKELEEKSIKDPDPKAREQAYQDLKALDDTYHKKTLELDARYDKDAQAQKDLIARLDQEKTSIEAAKTQNKQRLEAMEQQQKKREAETKEQERLKDFRNSYADVHNELRRFFWPNGDEVDSFYLNEAADAAKLEAPYLLSGKSPRDFMEALFRQDRAQVKTRMTASKAQFDKNFPSK